jgi:biopolymer transport protein ExbD
MNVKSGRSSQRHDLRQTAEINVTPFVDVMLVLLIVMMVAVPAATMAVKIDLPPVQRDKLPPKAPTFISVLADGRTLISDPVRGQQPTSLAALASGLVLSLGPGARQQPILIRADRAARYGDFMAVVNRLQADGFYKVSVITEDRNT